MRAADFVSRWNVLLRILHLVESSHQCECKLETRILTLILKAPEKYWHDHDMHQDLKATGRGHPGCRPTPRATTG